MNHQVHILEADVMEQAMAHFLLDANEAKAKNKKIKMNMEFRRKLEIRREEWRLARDIAEYDFI